MRQFIPWLLTLTGDELIRRARLGEARRVIEERATAVALWIRAALDNVAGTSDKRS
jgi:hypothetical protein